MHCLSRSATCQSECTLGSGDQGGCQGTNKEVSIVFYTRPYTDGVIELNRGLDKTVVACLIVFDD